MITLGLDIGSNSVGSAWVDTDEKKIVLGVSIFPAGVEESATKRGAPKNEHRRGRRSQRRSLARRAARKHHLRALLTSGGLLPTNADELKKLMEMNPWALRRKGLKEPLAPQEFGRILVHLNQRRGALGIQTDPDDEEEGKVKEAIDHLDKAMKDKGAETFGQFMADLMDERRHAVKDKNGNDKKRKDGTTKFFHDAIRNRRDAFEFHATRDLIQKEFCNLWDRQKELGGELAGMLTEDLRKQLDDETPDQTWRQKGIIFGQRRTYWDTGTLGRCDLEPADRCCPLADMHAQEFRVLETVNNIRISEGSSSLRPLTPEERARVKRALQSQKTGSVATVRKALGIDKAALKKKDLPDIYRLNLEADPDSEKNTDWFYREIVRGAITEDAWLKLDNAQCESVNRAILKFDPENPPDAVRLRNGAVQWWGLSPEAADKFVGASKKRPRLEKRLNLSRRAIMNLLPYMRDEGCGVTEAKQRFAEDGDNNATYQQRQRYAFGGSVLTKADRHFIRKHPDLLPPAPILANPVVRKGIHEVRRHVIAYIRKFGRKPERVVIELAREAKQTEKVRNKMLASNREREKERKKIIEDFSLGALPLNQQRAAVERVLLCRQQRGICLYTNKTITDCAAARGDDLEVDHILPLSRSQDNGLNNKVLCSRQTNRGKASKTPKEWLTQEQFSLVEQRMAHWEKEYPRKWENLHRDPQPPDDFINSQLTDTAYAATQVGSYLRDAFYAGEKDGKRHVFFTKGIYTAMLRRDWQLFQTLRKPDEDSPTDDQPGSKEGANPSQKNRGDHRQHAIDAAVVALTGPEIVKDVARLAAEREEYHERTGHWPKREPLPPPWGTTAEFRRQVLSQVFDVFDKADEDGTRPEGGETGNPLVVSHRPVKRKVVGAFHEETAYGPVLGSETAFTNRIRVEALTPNHLRVPAGWDDLSAKLYDESLSKGQKKAARKQMAMRPDVLPEKSGVVRDRDLRERIRKCLRETGLDPDNFTKEQIKKGASEGKLRLPSGVPVKSVVLLRTISDPVLIARKVYDPKTGKRVAESDPRTRRVYIAGNNHHIEIREDLKTGKWSGKVVTMLEAAQRARDNKNLVDRSDSEAKRFIMSLAEGETVRMRHPQTGQPGYFIVFKLDKPQTIHFIHHWDARPSKATQDLPPREDVGRGLTPNKLKNLGVEPGSPPCKVRVGPLGQVTPVQRD